MIDHYHANLADGTEVRWDIVKWGQHWSFVKTTFLEKPVVEQGEIYFTKSEACAAARSMRDELEKREATWPWP
jgi:hypothetical protein